MSAVNRYNLTRANLGMEDRELLLLDMARYAFIGFEATVGGPTFLDIDQRYGDMQLQVEVSGQIVFAAERDAGLTMLGRYNLRALLNADRPGEINLYSDVRVGKDISMPLTYSEVSFRAEVVVDVKTVLPAGRDACFDLITGFDLRAVMNACGEVELEMGSMSDIWGLMSAERAGDIRLSQQTHAGKYLAQPRKEALVELFSDVEIYVYQLFFVTRNAQLEVQGQHNLRALMDTQRESELEWLAKADARKLMLSVRNPRIDVVAETTAGKDINILRQPMTNLHQAVHVGKDMPVPLRTSYSQLQSLVHIGKLMPHIREAFLALHARVDTGLLRYEEATVHISIPPGGELRIDSDNFTTLLGEENVLWAYEGDWLQLHRDTTQVRIFADMGGELEGQILFAEHFV